MSARRVGMEAPSITLLDSNQARFLRRALPDDRTGVNGVIPHIHPGAVQQQPSHRIRHAQGCRQVNRQVPSARVPPMMTTTLITPRSHSSSLRRSETYRHHSRFSLDPLCSTILVYRKD